MYPVFSIEIYLAAIVEPGDTDEEDVDAMPDRTHRRT